RFVFVLLLLPLPAVAEEPRVDALGDPLPPRAVARLGTVRLRPGGTTKQLMFSPDCTQLASWADSRHSNTCISVWEVRTGKELHRVSQPNATLDDWGWLPNGGVIAIMKPDERETRRFECSLDGAAVKTHELEGADAHDRTRFAISLAAKLVAVSHAGT